ncbi:MAG TPA: hypothetical protein VKV26_07370 [Dehalococcoidia bacterium]|nr:hypothetical protein [Dehalococcoidia bacterium]
MATYTGTRKQNPRRHVALAIGAALALGLVAGLGSWQVGLRAHRSRTTARPQVQARGSGATPPSVAASGSTTGPAVSAGVRPTAQAPQFILVDTTDRAQQVQAELDAAEAIRLPVGLPPFAATIVPVDAGTANTLAQAVADLNAVRHSLGLPDVQIVDLRSDSTMTASPAPNGIAAAATEAQRALADENQLRASLDLTALPTPE